LTLSHQLSGTNTASLPLNPCYTLTLLLPTCVPYLLPYLLPSMLSPPVPLREVAGANDIIRIHVPFSMTDHSLKLKRDLAPSLITQPPILKKFKYLTQLFSTLILFPNPSLIFKENKQAEGGPQTPQGDLVKMAFKVSNN
jgi:hypothetical protein